MERRIVVMGQVLDEKEQPIPSVLVQYVVINQGSPKTEWLTTGQDGTFSLNREGSDLTLVVKKLGYFSIPSRSTNKEGAWRSDIFGYYTHELFDSFRTGVRTNPVILRLLKIEPPLRNKCTRVELQFSESEKRITFDGITDMSTGFHAVEFEHLGTEDSGAVLFRIRPLNGVISRESDPIPIKAPLSGYAAEATIKLTNQYLGLVHFMDNIWIKYNDGLYAQLFLNGGRTPQSTGPRLLIVKRTELTGSRLIDWTEFHCYSIDGDLKSRTEPSNVKIGPLRDPD